MRLRDILAQKGDRVVAVSPDATVHEAMRAMVDHQIGCLVVQDEGFDVRGIITERDILKFATARTDEVRTVRVEEVMSRNVIIGVPSDEVDCTMTLMTRNRIRHLPVVADRMLVGIVSIGDLVNAVRCDVELENRYLHDYISGVVA